MPSDLTPGFVLGRRSPGSKLCDSQHIVPKLSVRIVVTEIVISDPPSAWRVMAKPTHPFSIAFGGRS